MQQVGTKTLCQISMASAILLVASCVTNPLSTSVPYGFDLTGNWELVSGQSDPPPDLDDIASKELSREKRGKKPDPMSSISFVIQDFPVLVSTSLEIEQDSTSMGVAYSNSFYREVSWGRQDINDWEVKSGWSKGDLVLSMDRRKVDARETFVLSERNQTLTVTVSIKTPIDKMSFKRVFSKSQ